MEPKEIDNHKPEEFRPIPGYPDYEVSNLGTIRSLRTDKPRILEGSISCNVAGVRYREFSLQRSGFKIKDNRKGHLLVASAFMGPCPDGYYVRHINGNNLDNRLENLEYALKGYRKDYQQKDLIPVEKRYPPTETRVLLHSANQNKHWIGLLGESDKKFYLLDPDDNTHHTSDGLITHWTFLPVPIEE